MEESLIDNIKSTVRTFKLDLYDAAVVPSNITMTTTNDSTAVQYIKSSVNDNVQAFQSRQVSTKNARNTPHQSNTGTVTNNSGSSASSSRSHKK